MKEGKRDTPTPLSDWTVELDSVQNAGGRPLRRARSPRHHHHLLYEGAINLMVTLTLTP